MIASPARPATSDLAQVLGRFELFSELSPETLSALAASAHRRGWGAGGVIFQRGDEGDHMVAITEGRVRLSLGTAQGRELMLRQLGPWEVMGELAIIDGEPRSADATAVEPTTAIILPRARVLEIAGVRPDLGLAVARHLSRILRATNLQMESIALYDLRMRLVRFFLFSLRQVYGDRAPEEAVLQLNLSQSDLSAVLGASRPKLNQALQSLIAEGAVRRDGAHITCFPTRLRQLAELSDLRD
ncbi:cAMP-binding protein [Rubellimicrobium mesophilum DSM 19309]|uniref:cAMP-binding protein n=1 Tax=Rubellimicrobium mesophilum DSM 19309 TaxID=442562 RepID=A0A017HK64_9RHOB|nr:Crp/Fnr family transcriptional regulator [Rubellimicrobium mesophilum]EYD74892.1 cAMP-binding protein [Rubellimicrobium mesophilum DSM 19309]